MFKKQNEMGLLKTRSLIKKLIYSLCILLCFYSTTKAQEFSIPIKVIGDCLNDITKAAKKDKKFQIYLSNYFLPYFPYLKKVDGKNTIVIPKLNNYVDSFFLDSFNKVCPEISHKYVIAGNIGSNILLIDSTKKNEIINQVDAIIIQKSFLGLFKYKKTIKNDTQNEVFTISPPLNYKNKYLIICILNQYKFTGYSKYIYIYMHSDDMWIMKERIFLSYN